MATLLAILAGRVVVLSLPIGLVQLSASISGLYVSTELFQRLGIADQVLSASQRIAREQSAPWLREERQKSASSRSANS